MALAGGSGQVLDEHQRVALVVVELAALLGQFGELRGTEAALCLLYTSDAADE